MIDYLARNRTFAYRFIGQRIVSAVRLLSEAVDDVPRVAWGPALVDLKDGSKFVFDCEESLSNLIVNELFHAGPQWDAIQRRGVRPAIAVSGRTDPLHVLLTEPVTAIDAISRSHDVEPDMRRYYEMCGWRLRFSAGVAVCIGTHLTIDCVPSTAFLISEEVDPDLSYMPLAGFDP